MKEEDFIVGNWYKITSGSSFIDENDNWYIKYLKFSDKDLITCSEYFLNSKHRNGGHFGKIGNYTFKEVSLIEIAHLLPDDYPDLIIKQEIINDLSHVEPLIKLLKEIKNKKYV